MIRDIKKMSERHYDLIIIGGGITGAAVAWDASLAGFPWRCSKRTILPTPPAPPPAS